MFRRREFSLDFVRRRQTYSKITQGPKKVPKFTRGYSKIRFLKMNRSLQNMTWILNTELIMNWAWCLLAWWHNKTFFFLEIDHDTNWSWNFHFALRIITLVAFLDSDWACKGVSWLLISCFYRLKGKFRWLSEELKARLSTERRLKEQADWSQKRIRVCTAPDQIHSNEVVTLLFIGLHYILQLW